MNCPPTWPLLHAAYYRAILRVCPAWAMTLIRMSRRYAQQLLQWCAMEALAYRWHVLNYAPMRVVVVSA